METQNNIYNIFSGALKAQYIHGVEMHNWAPHKDPVWRSHPYTGIVTKGDSNAEYTIEFKEKGIFSIPKNSAFLIPSGQLFMITLKEPAYLGNAHIAYTIFEHIDILSFFVFPYLIEGAEASEVIRLVNELAACDEKQKTNSFDLYNSVRMQQLSFCLLEQFVKKAGPHPDINSKLDNINRLQDVIHYINDHLSEKICRKTLADIVHLSETRFHYVFKEIMGTSPMNYLMTQRLQNAQKMLLYTKDSISTIAETVGLENVPHFSRIFKNKYHVSPLRYRKMNQEFYV